MSNSQTALTTCLPGWHRQAAPQLLSIRASHMPLVSACAASTLVVDGEPRLDSGGESVAPANLGTATHLCLTEHIKGNRLDWSDVANNYGVDSDELAKLARWGLDCWGELRQWYPQPDVEVPLEFTDESNGIRLTGHVDVLSVTPEQIRLADFKSGWVDADATQQLRAYGWLALHKFPTVPEVYAALVRFRDRRADGWVWSREQLTDWYSRFVEHLAGRTGPDPYNPGPHCRFCPRGAVCPAKTQLIAQAAHALTMMNGDGLPVEPARLAELVDKMALLTTVIDSARKLIKSTVQAAGGSLALGDGRELTVTTQDRRTLRVNADVRDYLAEKLPAEQWGQVVKASITELEKAVKSGVKRGGKGEAWMKTVADIEERDGIEVKQIERLEVRRSAPPQLEGPR